MVRSAKTGVAELLWWGSLAFFLLPFISVFSIFSRAFARSGLEGLDFEEFFWAFKNSLQVGVLTATLVCGFGFWLAGGLIWLQNRRPVLSSWVQVLLTIPFYMPPFFVILSFLYWLSFAPSGIFSTAFTLTLLYLGFAAVIFASTMTDRFGELAEASWVFGVSRRTFFLKTFPLLAPVIVAVFVFVFSAAFASFSVPLVLGGGRGTTVEILIYEKMRISFDVRSAVTFSVIQSLFLALVTSKFPFDYGQKQSRSKGAGLLASGPAVMGIFAYLILVLGPWILHPFIEGALAWNQLTGAPGIWELLLKSLILSLQLSLGAFGVSLVFALICIYLFIEGRSLLFLRLIFPISVALLGLVGIVLSDRFGAPALVYLFLNLALSFPLIYRLFLMQGLSGLQQQISIARVLGAGSWEILRKVVVPQMVFPLAAIGSVSFLWVFGDFALVRYFFPSGATVTLLIENLMSSYRIQGAMALGFVVIFIGGLLQWFVWRVAHVFDSKVS